MERRRVWRTRGMSMYPNQPRDPWRTALTTVGIVLAVVVAVGGLAIVGAAVFFIVAMNNYGSNK